MEAVPPSCARARPRPPGRRPPCSSRRWRPAAARPAQASCSAWFSWLAPLPSWRGADWPGAV
eukprot:6737305-Lingulodinium_polyedra.AAC.1